MSASPFILPPAPERLDVVRERVRLRPVVETDLEAMAQYRGDPEVCRFLPFEPQTADDIRARVGHVLEEVEISGKKKMKSVRVCKRKGCGAKLD